MGWINTLTVSVAAAQTFIDLTTFKADHGVTSSTYDTLLQRQIDRACSTLVREIGRDLLSQTYVETWEFTRESLDEPLILGLDVLQLSRYPVTAIASIVEGSDTLTTAEYRRDNDAGLLYRLNSDNIPKVQRWGREKIVVTYTAGFSTVPDDLEEAASLLAWARYKARNRDRDVQSKFIDGVERVEYFEEATGIPPEVQATIDAYRGPRFR